MIQRVQSVFLLLVAVSMTSFVFLPYWTIANGNESHFLYPLFHVVRVDGTDTQSYNPWALTGALAIIAAVIAVIEIFRYNNRMQQIKIGFFNSLLMASALAVTFWFSSKGQQEFAPDSMGQYMLPGFFLPAIAMVFNILANRFIRRDENLVRSVDRLR